MGIVTSITDTDGTNRSVEMEPVQGQKLKKVGDVNKIKSITKIKISNLHSQVKSGLSQIKLKRII